MMHTPSPFFRSLLLAVSLVALASAPVLAGTPMLEPSAEVETPTSRIVDPQPQSQPELFDALSATACSLDVCSTCSRPVAGVDYDSDGLPDRLEHDLAHRFFPDVRLQWFIQDLAATYLYNGAAIPFSAQPLTAGECDESLECVELRWGLAYHTDYGDDLLGGGHLGDSELYVALVQRTTSWSTASGDASAWRVIRDFTSAHWQTLVDSSKIGAYGYCPPNCHNWDNDETSCQAASQCSWFPGLCTGQATYPGDFCSDYWQEASCYSAGCTWFDSSCSPPSDVRCYSSSPRATQVTVYAAEGKHANYHSDSECDGGGFLNADDCPYNSYNMRSYKGLLLQNVGNPDNHGNFDTIIQHPNGCNLYAVWGGADFGESSDYNGHFRHVFGWGLPAPLGLDGQGNPFTYSNLQDMVAACYGIAGSDKPDCTGVGNANDRKLCEAEASSSTSPCYSITTDNLENACFGMVSGVTSHCTGITDSVMKNFCLGVGGHDSSACNRIADTDTQILCHTLNEMDIYYCDYIGDWNKRYFCKAVGSPNDYYCSKLR